LGGESLCLVFQGVAFNESEMSRKGQGAPFKKGLFSVKSFYCVMGGRDCACFPWKSVWQTKVPLRVAFFVWLVALGKIFTMGND
jgi:hypothetical protein